MPTAVINELAGLADGMAAWTETEAALSKLLPGHDVYLGGDGLRPYLSWTDHHTACLVAVRRPMLLPPPFLEEVLGGAYGVPIIERDAADSRVVTARVSMSNALSRRLRTPKCLLIGLADAERYRGARLPLGVARLSQWLRFTHSARVTVVDYNLEALPLELVRQELSDQNFDVVGVSVNFGQWGMLEELSLTVNEFEPPIVVLGNILAAHSPDRAAALFAASAKQQLLVATTLGERPLEALCRGFDDPPAWRDIPGLILVEGRGRPPSSRSSVEPPTVVFPDDAMVLAVAQRGGQISLETSFGCQFGACTFCPRDHRGNGWTRAETAAIIATLERVSELNTVVSFVDEEFFGAEGLIESPQGNLAAAEILSACRRLGISYELYTRLEQLFDRRRSPSWNMARARLLAQAAPSMRRLFVGVESGSPSQLRRYGKGQTVAQIVDSLTVGSALGLPLEFGFITFDPVLTPSELAENIAFLARPDILATQLEGSSEDLAAAATAYLDGAKFVVSGVPLYQRVAYMATELEVLTHSRYADRLRRAYPELLTGRSDPNFARYEVIYQDERIGEIAGWCRVWTEGMFVPIYEARMRARTSDDRELTTHAKELVTRYREATFALLVALTSRSLVEVASKVSAYLPEGAPIDGADPKLWLTRLSDWTLRSGATVDFDVRLRGHGRQT